jgi:hypothetical protein
MEVLMYSSTHSQPQHWMKMSGQLHAPTVLSTGEEPPEPIGEEAGCSLSRSEEKIYCPCLESNADSMASCSFSLIFARSNLKRRLSLLFIFSLTTPIGN